MMTSSAYLETSATSPPPVTASDRLLALMKPRADLRGAFKETWNLLSSRLIPTEREAWAKAVLELVDVNAGPGCLTTYWRLSCETPRDLDFNIEVATCAADICRHAGARAAAATLDANGAARTQLKAAGALLRWWQTMTGLARAAPDCIELLSRRVSDALISGDIDTFENFVAAGLRKSADDRAGRRTFFALEDDIARRLVQRERSCLFFADVERKLNLYLTALWGRTQNLRALEGAGNSTQPRRSNIAGPLIRLPKYFPGLNGDAASDLFRASATHASAHLSFGGLPFRVGSLRPLQIAFVNLIEDARVEALAMQRFPGLRTLWASYHVAQPSDLVTADAIMARLARALFDPTYKDDNGVVAKGRRLFEAAWARLDDPSISRDIGGLLGNDLGQMRLQFNAKTYVVEPSYRDDGLGLWEFDDDNDVAAEIHEIAIEAARIERREKSEGMLDDDRPVDVDPAGRARAVAPDSRGMVIAHYPEWDRASGLERRDWTTVREVAAIAGDPHWIEEGLDSAGSLRARIRQSARRARVGRSTRMKRQAEGQELDLDAVLDAGIALRSGELPDPRIFQSSHIGMRSISVVILIDISESTRDPTASGGSVLDAERVAVAALSEAMTAVGDPFALLAFASNGHDDVRLMRIKSFADPYDRDAMARLAGLKPGLSTRLGAALRHAGAALESVASYRKLVIALTDGEPSDIDTDDPRDLAEDARRAVIRLRDRGIDSFGVVVGSSFGSAPSIFGRANAMPVRRVEDLPARLSELYFRLSRR